MHPRVDEPVDAVGLRCSHRPTRAVLGRELDPGRDVELHEHVAAIGRRP